MIICCTRHSGIRYSDQRPINTPFNQITVTFSNPTRFNFLEPDHCFYNSRVIITTTSRSPFLSCVLNHTSKAIMGGNDSSDSEGEKSPEGNFAV